MSQETQNTVAVESVGEAPSQISAGGFSSMVPLILIFVIFYFLLFRPQEKKRKAQEQLISTVKPGENIVTHSGIFGRVVKVNDNDNTISLEIAKAVEIKIMKSSVSDILNRKETASSAAPKVEKAAEANKPAKAKKIEVKKAPSKTIAKKGKK